MKSKRQLGSRGQPAASRQSILDAALREFSEHGVAGARIDAIASAAGVNKALLYYYYGDKEGLYGAVLDSVFEPLTQRLHAVLERELPPGEKMMAYVGTHFDCVASQSQYPRIVQHELMRAGSSTSPHLEHIVSRYFRPLFVRIAKVLADGMRDGTFRDVDPRHFVMSMVAVVVFYFSSTPIARSFSKGEPLAPAALRARRSAVLDMIAAALFVDRAEAERVLRLRDIATPAFLSTSEAPRRERLPVTPAPQKYPAATSARRSRK